MSNQIQTFTFTQAEVRTAKDEKGEPLFCLADVAKILAIQNSRDIVAKQLDSKGVEKIYIPTNSGQQQVTFINEPNLYRVIFRSNKPEAVQFQNWIFDEVIPTIRKTGSYSNSSSNPQSNLHLACLQIVLDEASKSLGTTREDLIQATFGMVGGDNVYTLSPEQIVEVITNLFIQVTAGEYPEPLPQLNHPVAGEMPKVVFRPALNALIHEVAGHYVDKDNAFLSIMHHLEQECRVANISFLTKDRLSIALRTLAKLNDESLKHERQITLLDQSALRSISGNGMQLCYVKAV